MNHYLKRMPGVANNKDLVGLACAMLTPKTTAASDPEMDSFCEKAALDVWRAVHFGEPVQKSDLYLTCYVFYEVLTSEGIKISFEKWKEKYYGYLKEHLKPVDRNTLTKQEAEPQGYQKASIKPLVEQQGVSYIHHSGTDTLSDQKIIDRVNWLLEEIRLRISPNEATHEGYLSIELGENTRFRIGTYEESKDYYVSTLFLKDVLRKEFHRPVDVVRWDE